MCSVVQSTVARARVGVVCVVGCCMVEREVGGSGVLRDAVPPVVLSDVSAMYPCDCCLDPAEMKKACMLPLSLSLPVYHFCITAWRVIRVSIHLAA